MSASEGYKLQNHLEVKDLLQPQIQSCSHSLFLVSRLYRYDTVLVRFEQSILDTLTNIDGDSQDNFNDFYNQYKIQGEIDKNEL